ncbi:hypothetical protein Tco_0217330, partial [Tanacetum coccineum]
MHPLILKTLHTTPPNEDYVAPATKPILDELLENKILNVAMVDEKADPTRDLEELERLLVEDHHFTEIQVLAGIEQTSRSPRLVIICYWLILVSLVKVVGLDRGYLKKRQVLKIVDLKWRDALASSGGELGSQNLNRPLALGMTSDLPKLHYSRSGSLPVSASLKGSHDQLNVNQQTIAYCLCWGLEIDIAEILFSDLIASLHPPTGKQERKANICYTRYLSLIMEHLLKDAYKNENLMYLKPHNITAITFKPTLENEIALTAHMCKVVALSPDPIKSFLPPSGEVNADDTVDKSSSETSVQPVTQSKAPTVKRPRKKK